MVFAKVALEPQRQHLCQCAQVYIYRFIQLFMVAFALGTLFVKPRMSTTDLQVHGTRLKSNPTEVPQREPVSADCSVELYAAWLSTAVLAGRCKCWQRVRGAVLLRCATSQ